VGLCAIALLVVVGCRRDRESAPVAAQPAVTAQPSVAAQPAVTAQPVAPPPKPAQLAHVTIKALGMTCEESCPMRVRYALAGIQDIYELGFDLPNESIFVSYDASLGPAKQVTKPMLAAIKNAGFDPWLAKESWPADAQAQVLWRDVK
jgi:hypothetical protein